MNKLLAIVAAALGLAGIAHAQYPQKPIHVVVPFAAGGAVDVIARIIGEQLSRQVGQPVVVDNKAGANGNIATDFVAKAAPDGYTVLIAANGLATNAALFADLPYNVQRDLAAVAYVGYAPLVLVASESFKPQTLAQLISEAKAHPGKLNYASAGTGSSQHLAVEMLKSSAGFEATHIPYKGGAPAIVDMLGGRVDFMMLNPLEALPHLKAGRLHALAVGGAQRLPLLPDVPTAAESGVPGYEATTWWAFLVPAKTPREVVAKLNAEINAALAEPAVKKKLEDMGAIVATGTPEQLDRFIRGETDKWGALIRKANIRPD
jgi:tripartite-type tricarboxylate transporter receptor subunit TctC